MGEATPPYLLRLKAKTEDVETERVRFGDSRT